MSDGIEELCTVYGTLIIYTTSCKYVATMETRHLKGTSGCAKIASWCPGICRRIEQLCGDERPVITFSTSRQD